MKIGKLKYLLMLVAVTLLLGSCSSKEDKVLTHDIEIIVPWKAGTTEDKVASEVSELLIKQLDEDGIDIEVKKSNISGLSGALGMQEFLSEDEETRKILINSEAAAFYKPLGLSDFGIEDIEIFKMLVSDTDVLISKRDDRFQTLESLIIQIKENPNRISMGYSGVGTNSNVYMKAFENAGLKIGKKVYESQVDVIEAVNNGEIDFAVVSKNLADDYLILEDTNVRLIGYFSNEDVEIDGAEIITARLKSMENYISKYNPIYISLDKAYEVEEDEYIKELLDKIFVSEDWKKFVKDAGLEDITNLNKEEIDDYWMNYVNNRIDIISQ